MAGNWDIYDRFFDNISDNKANDYEDETRDVCFVVNMIGYVPFEAQGDEEPGVEGPAVEGKAVEGKAVEGPAVEGKAVEGPAVEGPAVEGKAVEGKAVEGKAVEGPAVEGPAVEGPAMEGPAVEGKAVEGPAVEGKAVEGKAVEGPAVEAVKATAVEAVNATAVEAVKATTVEAVKATAVEGKAVKATAKVAIASTPSVFTYSTRRTEAARKRVKIREVAFPDRLKESTRQIAPSLLTKLEKEGVLTQDKEKTHLSISFLLNTMYSVSYGDEGMGIYNHETFSNCQSSIPYRVSVAFWEPTWFRRKNEFVEVSDITKVVEYYQHLSVQEKLQFLAENEKTTPSHFKSFESTSKITTIRNNWLKTYERSTPWKRRAIWL
ncbi:uncharacterized protein LOC118433530 [Folsomia candida]|nr:uncharacterized protein LOC118433530 [Folsomia candida]